jgi:hypothetical protein
VVDGLWVQFGSIHDTDTGRLVCRLDCHTNYPDEQVRC